mmetsp:Transcript_26682/g.42744  ORF Transcript_26682/g.42744 Transcript_26682/m.42744 type:complete len:100 (+) Transcript_26682:123-422(+)
MTGSSTNLNSYTHCGSSKTVIIETTKLCGCLSTVSHPSLPQFLLRILAHYAPALENIPMRACFLRVYVCLVSDCACMCVCVCVCPFVYVFVCECACAGR